MVSFTVDFVVVELVILPWVKFGTTGTAWAVALVSRITTALVAIFQSVFPKIVITRITHLIVNSVTNCPVADVPAPPAVRLIEPSVVIVPARVPAVPEALEV